MVALCRGLGVVALGFGLEDVVVADKCRLQKTASPATFCS